jgi:hypothetical protein
MRGAQLRASLRAAGKVLIFHYIMVFLYKRGLWTP